MKKKRSRRSHELSESARNKISAFRKQRNFSVEKLAKLIGVDPHWVMEIENFNKEVIRKDEKFLMNLTELMGTTVDELIYDKPSLIFEDSNSSLFENYISLCGDIDRDVLPVVRDHKELPAEKLNEELLDLIDIRFRKQSSSFEDFKKLCNDEAFQLKLVTSLSTPALRLVVGDNFREIQILANNKSIQVRNPLLLWDCHCATPELDGRMPTDNEKCPIDKHQHGKEFLARFRAGLVSIEYNGAKYLYKNSENLWPPSIDSFLFLKTLKENGLLDDDIESVLDLGSGTGFLGIELARNNPHIVNVTLSDWLLAPMLFGSINWALNRGEHTYKQVKSELRLFYLGSEPQKPIDLVVCNPPYLPELTGFENLKMEKTVAGTELLSYVIKNAHKLGKQVYVQFSSIASQEAKAAEFESGNQLIPVGEEHRIPFRVHPLWERRGYLKELVDQRGLEVNKSHRHRYWHRIRCYRVSTD